jgi:hypothetical protein
MRIISTQGVNRMKRALVLVCALFAAISIAAVGTQSSAKVKPHPASTTQQRAPKSAKATQTPSLPHDPQSVEISGVRLGVSTFDQVKKLLEQGAKENKYADLMYYEGLYFDSKSDKLAYRQVADTFQNYDAQHLVKTITGFWSYSTAYPRVPFQMFFFRNVVYKVDLGLQKGLIEELKAAFDGKYGKGEELSIVGPGVNEVYGIAWQKLKQSQSQVLMVLDTGMYSLSSRPDFYMLRIDDKMPDSFYCNFFDRTLEGAYLDYRKTLQEQRNHQAPQQTP